jgi:hypothetical protein
MHRRHKSILKICLSAALLAQQTLPALALRPPVGAVAGANKLMQGATDNPDDLAFSPLLLEMAKLIGRVGLSPGFFLQNDGVFSDEPSIDLRTLLLYQAGLIKLPLHGNPLKKSPDMKEQTVPTLSFPGIPEQTEMLSAAPPSDLPSLESDPLPRDIERDQVLTPHASVGQPDRISIIAKAPNTGATPHFQSDTMVSLDIGQLQSELSDPDERQPRPTRLVADIPHLAMAMPRTNVMPFITRNMFRLWTWRTDADNATGAEELPAAHTHNYNGTFVIATTGAIKSITGRHFQLAPGRLLANNQGGELLFQTDLATVSVEPEATVAVEVVSINNNNLMKIYSLESSDQQGVVVSSPNGKEKPWRLGPGEMLILANHPITDADLAGSHIASKNKLSANIVRGTFAVNNYVQEELILKSQAQGEQFQTLTLLKHRLSNPR